MTDGYYPPIVIANWKMNGLLADGVQRVTTLLHTIGNPACEVVLCPPATLLSAVLPLLEGTMMVLGGQDCHQEQKGAYTGDISAMMLKDLSCRYVILGHSERRAYHLESNVLIGQKAASALQAGLIPIICVGESETERQSGAFLSVIAEQLRESLPENANPGNTIIAYEPVWAIGSGKIPSVSEIEEVHNYILETLGAAFRVVYGGSVKPENTGAIITIPAVHGLLVGGCSLNADDFLHIVQLVDKNHLVYRTCF